jgi:hypothetical protein
MLDGRALAARESQYRNIATISETPERRVRDAMTRVLPSSSVAAFGRSHAAAASNGSNLSWRKRARLRDRQRLVAVMATVVASRGGRRMLSRR